MPENSYNIQRKLVIPCDASELKKAREFIREVVELSKLDNSEHNMVVLAIDEALSNVIEHAYQNSTVETTRTVEVEFIGTEAQLETVISDQGTYFDPSNIPDIDMEDHVKKRKKNGLGIFMIRQIMDEIEYTYKDGVRNTLRLIKYYEENN